MLVAKNKSKPEPEQPAEQKTKKKRITEPVNVIDVAQRPYMSVKPAGTNNIVVAVNQLNKPATEMEYELEYQSGSLLQGAFGQIEVTELPVTEKILLGSCSAGGACTYHKDVTGGKLLTRFTGGEEKYILQSEWRYYENNADGKYSSRDAKFQLETEDLSGYVIVANSPGYPEGLEKAVISDIYSLGAASLNGSGQLSIRAAAESATATIMGYDGTEWTEFETTVEGKVASAEVELMELYLVVE